MRRFIVGFKSDSSVLSLFLFLALSCPPRCVRGQTPANEVPLKSKVQYLQTDHSLDALSQQIRANEVLYEVFQVSDMPPYFIFISSDERVKDRSILAGTSEYVHPLKVVSSSRQGAKQLGWSIYDAHAETTYATHRVDYKSSVSEVKSDQESTATHDSSSEHTVPHQEVRSTLQLNCSQPKDGVQRDIQKTFSPLGTGEARALLSKIKLYGEISTTHRPYRLFRDDWGVYYYIEEHKSPAQGERFRLWRGYRGSMSLLNVMTAAADTEGVVLISKDAAMRLVSKRGENRSVRSENGEMFGAFWTQAESASSGQKRKSLVEVPTQKNQSVIFNDLGIYDGLYLGSVCDPLYHRDPNLMRDLDPENTTPLQTSTP